MTKILARVKILPTSIDVDLDKLAERVEEGVSNVAKLHSYYTEPIAFGLSALVADFILEEREGGTEPLEEALKKVEGVGELDVIAISRMSTKL